MNQGNGSALSFSVLPGIPEVRPGDDLADLLCAALERSGEPPQPQDVLVVSQKIVSKAENRYVALRQVEPGAEARALAQRCLKDPRLVELVLRESSEIVRCAPGVLIARHRLGFVVANAAIDQSNLDGAEDERALLLPLEPDTSAAVLRARIASRFGLKALGVLISDSFGRPWRMGLTGVCIGCAGMRALLDCRGQSDRGGRVLKVTQIAVGDALCATAALVSGEGAEGTPVTRVRGAPPACFDTSERAAGLLRPLSEDLFR